MRELLGLAESLLRLPERLADRLALAGEAAIEVRHERGGGTVLHVPKADDDRTRASEQERASQTHDALATHDAAEPGLASGEHRQVGVEGKSLDFGDVKHAVGLRFGALRQQ